MAYPGEAVGKHMQQESPDEFLIGDRRLLQFGFILVILPQKTGHPLLNREDSVVADYQTVGVPSQILEHPLCTVERFLGVCDPVLLVAGIDQG